MGTPIETTGEKTLWPLGCWVRKMLQGESLQDAHALNSRARQFHERNDRSSGPAVACPCIMQSDYHAAMLLATSHFTPVKVG